VVDERRVDMSRWGEWVRAGSERWTVVGRSWSVFQRNTTELMNLLNTPATDPVVAAHLMVDDGTGPAPFWEELDQRLHNQLASAASLVDHRRRLLRYYKADFPAFIAEDATRNASVAQMKEGAFLGDLRNYLLHYGSPPLIQSLKLGPNRAGGSGHSVKLSAARLLEWRKWSAASRDYLASFGERDGPVLGRDVAAYANAMSGLFTWFFQQRQVVMDGGNVPDRLRIDADRNH
jgi:hypothetical protein